MELYIFRHGEKRKKGRYIGQADVDLTFKGQRQNIKIGRALKALKVDKIFTSDLQRTFVDGGIKQKTLREIGFGDWEGHSWKEIKKKFPKDALNYLSDPLHFRFPGGENYQELENRVISWLNELKRKQYSRVGLVIHQGVIRTIVHYFKGTDFWKIEIKQGKGINKITI